MPVNEEGAPKMTAEDSDETLLILADDPDAENRRKRLRRPGPDLGFVLTQKRLNKERAEGRRRKIWLRIREIFHLA